MKKIAYFTKDELVAAVRAGNERGYNRQMNLDVVESEMDDLKFPVVFSMLHEHIAGERVEPHMRVVIVTDLNGGRSTLDVSMERFNELPVAEIEEED